MSVINKVLRDLDKRQSASNRPASDPVRRYTVGVETPAPPRRKVARHSRWGVWLTLLLLVAVAGGAVGWLRMKPDSVRPSDVPLILQLKDDDVLNLPAVVPAAPVDNTVAAVPPADPIVIAEPIAAKPTETVFETKTPPVVAARPPPPTAPAVQAPTAAAKPLPVAEPLPKPVAPQAVAAADSTAKAPAAAPPTAQRQQQAARDALVQAQTLWNTSAQDTAVSTLQAAVAVAERQDSAGMLVPLVRELARMELALGQPAAVLELLVRLEPQLKNQPDLWAVRANAAQRLGRHQDSVLAYGVALQSRPAEARWLLGMAVSLAAMGQTTQAGTMVEKARASGPISAEVALYLRQQGVPMPDGK
jgi:MSHA biogenesis protein MshN